MNNNNENYALNSHAVSNSASHEPDFRTNPSGWIGWNMKVYGNDFETAKTLLYQRMWLMSF